MHKHQSQTSDSLLIHPIASILKVFSQCSVYMTLSNNVLFGAVHRYIHATRRFSNYEDHLEICLDMKIPILDDQIKHFILKLKGFLVVVLYSVFLFIYFLFFIQIFTKLFTLVLFFYCLLYIHIHSYILIYLTIDLVH